MPTLYFADDEGLTTKYIVEALESSGFEVEAFESGEDLWDRYEVKPCDIIVTDDRMHVISGNHVCKATKERGNHTKTILTSVIKPPDMAADAFVEKNGDFKKYVDAIVTTAVNMADSLKEELC